MVTSPLLVTCILMASNTYQLPPAAMVGIMAMEGGRVGQEAGPNPNGSYDLGPMQVNSSWLPRLAHIWHVNQSTARLWVRDNGCVNVYVATWILKQDTIKAGNLYGGIAQYNSASPGIGRRYAAKVVAIMDRKGLIRHDDAGSTWHHPELIAASDGR